MCYLWCCKRPSFALQKVAFRRVKDGLLQRERRPFAKRQDGVCIKNVNKWRFYRLLFALSPLSNTFANSNKSKQDKR